MSFYLFLDIRGIHRKFNIAPRQHKTYINTHEFDAARDELRHYDIYNLAPWQVI